MTEPEPAIDPALAERLARLGPGRARRSAPGDGPPDPSPARPRRDRLPAAQPSGPEMAPTAPISMADGRSESPANRSPAKQRDVARSRKGAGPSRPHPAAAARVLLAGAAAAGTLGMVAAMAEPAVEPAEAAPAAPAAAPAPTSAPPPVARIVVVRRHHTAPTSAPGAPAARTAAVTGTAVPTRAAAPAPPPAPAPRPAPATTTSAGS